MSTGTDDRTTDTPGQIAPVVPAPLDWQSVAIVAFIGNKPVLISSAEPHVLLETFIENANETSADDDERENDFDDEDDEKFAAKADRMREFVKSWRWELYSLEDAKAVFFEGYGK